MQPQRYGKYILVDRISTGGMAEVYLALAETEAGGRACFAIKRILPFVAQDEEFQLMFADEARISLRLDHDNICKMFEFGTVDDEYYLALEYVSGKNLRQIVSLLRQQQQKLSIPMAIFICARLCDALDYAHRQLDDHGRSMEIVHRDVSPPNVLISYDGVVKLIDFGIAKATHRSVLTQAGRLKGKFAYMAPEQVEGAKLDRRTDVFAVGILLYEMVTGERPFFGDNQLAIMHKVRKAEYRSPTELNPQIDAALSQILARSLARKREDRFSWASEMRDELERYLAQREFHFSESLLADWMNSHFADDVYNETERCSLLLGQDLTHVEETTSAWHEPSTVAPESGVPALTGVITSGEISSDKHTFTEDHLTNFDAPSYVEATEAGSLVIDPVALQTEHRLPASRSSSEYREREHEHASDELYSDDGQTQIETVALPAEVRPADTQHLTHSLEIPPPPQSTFDPKRRTIEITTANIEHAIETGHIPTRDTVDEPHERGASLADHVTDSGRLAHGEEFAPNEISSSIFPQTKRDVAAWRLGEGWRMMTRAQRAVAFGVALSVLLAGGWFFSVVMARPTLIKSGGIALQTQPGATCAVTLDGKPQGVLTSGRTLRFSSMSDGAHTVALNCPDFVYQEVRTTVEAEKIVQLVVQLQREPND